MALFRDTGDERWRTIVERTLDLMADGGLWDARGGGFYRYSATRDWQLPHVEKLLETNAELLRAYAEAALVFGRPGGSGSLRRHRRVHHGRLAIGVGGYRGSAADRMLYMDGNAKAAGALVGAATVLDDSELAREALASFERVILLCYKPGSGLAHYSDGVARVRGLLADQIHTAGALLDAHDVSGLSRYRMMAEELTRVAVRDLWDEPAGGFLIAPRTRPTSACCGSGGSRSSLTPKRHPCSHGWNERRRPDFAPCGSRAARRVGTAGGAGPARRPLRARRAATIDPVIS